MKVVLPKLCWVLNKLVQGVCRLPVYHIHSQDLESFIWRHRLGQGHLRQAKKSHNCQNLHSWLTCCFCEANQIRNDQGRGEIFILYKKWYRFHLVLSFNQYVKNDKVADEGPRGWSLKRLPLFLQSILGRFFTKTTKPLFYDEINHN